MGRGGFILVPRELLDPSHPLHPQSRGDRACALAAFLDLISRARWRDGPDLERGQLRVSQNALAQLWHWERSTVQRILAELESLRLIRRTPGSGRQPDIITICDYDSFQGSRTASNAANDPAFASTKRSMDASTTRSPLEEGEGEGKEEVTQRTTSSFHSEVGPRPDQDSNPDETDPTDMDPAQPIREAAEMILHRSATINRGTVIGLTRRLLGSPDASRDASVLDDMMSKGSTVMQIAEAVVGLAWARESGMLEGFIDSDTPCSLRILRTDRRERSVWDIARSAFQEIPTEPHTHRLSPTPMNRVLEHMLKSGKNDESTSGQVI